MDRSDLLPENQLLKRVTDLERDLAELNTYQRLGSHSQLSGRLVSPAAYDIEVTNIPALGMTPVTVTFTPSSTLFNNLSLVHRLMYTYTADLTYGHQEFMTLERFLPSNNQQTWKIYVYNISGSHTLAWVRIKLYFFVIGSGTFTAV